MRSARCCSMKPVSVAPARYAGWRTTRSRNARLVVTPRIAVSARASCIRSDEIGTMLLDEAGVGGAREVRRVAYDALEKCEVGCDPQDRRFREGFLHQI